MLHVVTSIVRRESYHNTDYWNAILRNFREWYKSIIYLSTFDIEYANIAHTTIYTTLTILIHIVIKYCSRAGVLFMWILKCEKYLINSLPLILVTNVYLIIYSSILINPIVQSKCRVVFDWFFITLLYW